MAFEPDDLRERLRELTAGRDIVRWLVAYSGGIDSTVLLHALHAALPSASIVAVHIDHGLQPAAADWERHCRAFADDLGVEYVSKRVAVDPASAGGPEAAAREARYTALLPLVGEGDCLLSGHHENDQAETLLLNLLRGSGPAGLAGIGASQSFGGGLLLRPMLSVAGADIRDYAARHELAWIDDPSNVDTRFDRNFLRNEVMPLLKSRWPAAAANLRRSAGLISESSDLLAQLADADLERCGQPSRLAAAQLRTLDPARQRNVLRRAVRLSGLPPPPATRLYQAIDELVPARDDAQPRVTWPGGELRRFGGFVFVLPETAAATTPGGQMVLPDSAPVAVGDRLGRIRLSFGNGRGLDPDTVRSGLRIAFRRGGEAIRIRDGGPTRKLKKLLQEAGILPWMRDRLPLLYANDRLVAVADLWLSADATSEPGYTIEWIDKPLICAEID